jgi:hypothetical protein
MFVSAEKLRRRLEAARDLAMHSVDHDAENFYDSGRVAGIQEAIRIVLELESRDGLMVFDDSSVSANRG